MMIKSGNDSISDMIEREKRNLVRESLNEVWEALLLEDVNPAVIAEVITEASLKRLAAEQSDEPAIQLLDRLQTLCEMGLVPENRVLQ